MLTHLHVKNFRSLKNLSVALAPLNVVYGPNGAGKSSLAYSLLVLRQIILNPAQSLDGFFNLAFTNLGDFAGVVHDHRSNLTVHLGVEGKWGDLSLAYGVDLVAPNKGSFSLGIGKDASLRVDVTFPYSLGQQRTHSMPVGDASLQVSWNGITCQATASVAGKEVETSEVLAKLNGPAEVLRRTDIVPVRRGFSKPSYGPVGLGPIVISEDELATLLARDRYLHGPVSRYLESVTGRDFRIYVPPGTSTVYLQTMDRSTGLNTDLVNEGFGINQLVYLFAKCLRPETALVCIEEPETNLHPTAVRRLAECLARVAQEEGKQLIITTHSEVLVTSFLDLVVDGRLKPDDLACYLATKDGKATHLERQRVNDKGQIEGGLASFMGTELESLKAFLKLN